MKQSQRVRRGEFNLFVQKQLEMVSNKVTVAGRDDLSDHLSVFKSIQTI